MGYTRAEFAFFEQALVTVTGLRVLAPTHVRSRYSVFGTLKGNGQHGKQRIRVLVEA